MLEWFKNKTKMKRWILVILMGVSLLCFAFAEVITVEELTSVIDALKIIIAFVVGFALLIIGIVFCEKRTLELFIEAGSKDNINIKSLVFNNKIYDKGQNIVVIGGGARNGFFT